MPSLRRVGDGAGDSGPMSVNFLCEKINEQWKLVQPLVQKHGKPRLNHMIRVGSPYGRTHTSQDYWTTTPIVEIVEDTSDYVRFRTTNSEYEWKA